MTTTEGFLLGMACIFAATALYIAATFQQRVQILANSLRIITHHTRELENELKLLNIWLIENSEANDLAKVQLRTIHKDAIYERVATEENRTQGLEKTA